MTPSTTTEETAPMTATRQQVDEDQFESLVNKARLVREELGKIIVGQQQVIDKLLISIFAGGHCLMMGVPGLAKTLMVNSLARALHLSFKRIQFTPDLMPGDITGSEVIQQQPDGSKRFVMVEGPLFANMILADEINRTPPKTQAALLEAMQEHSVTVGNQTHKLPEPFFVLATQNPIEQEGTYPLPEAQQDRFMFFLWVDYPKREEEYAILQRTTSTKAPRLQPVMSGADILAIHRLVRQIPISEPLVRYAAHLVRATRTSCDDNSGEQVPEFVRKYLQWGAGPRAGQYLILGAKAKALLDGHSHVAAEDIREVTRPVLQHRLIVNFTAEAEGIKPVNLIDRILEEVQP